jgi:hypothetical protein
MVPDVGSLHIATAREVGQPGGLERVTIPSDDNVSTAQPGSSERTEA